MRLKSITPRWPAFELKAEANSQGVAWGIVAGRWFLSSQLFIALCAVALTLETSLLASIPFHSADFYAFVFFATLACYRLHGHVRSVELNRRGPAPLLTVLAFATALVLIPALHRHQLTLVTLAALAATLYSVPLAPGWRRLRECGCWKIIVLTGVWTLITSILPAIDSAAPPMIFVLVVRRFLFVFAICLAFDDRDRIADANAGIRTLAVRLGQVKTIALSRAALLLFAILTFVPPSFPIAAPGTSGTTFALLLSASATWAVLEWAQVRSTPTVFLLGLDGMLLLQPILVWGVGTLSR